MKQLSAVVTASQQVLPAFRKRGARPITASNMLWLDCSDIAWHTTPGKYVMVRCGEKSVLSRPFSVSQVVKESFSLYFSVFEDGKGTRWLSERKIGDRIAITGPLGNGFSIDGYSSSILLISGGAGIAPLIYLAHEALRAGRTVTLLMGASTANQLFPANLLPSGVVIIKATEDGTAGKKGMVTGLLPDHIARADQIFACGPEAMYRELAQKYGEILRDKPVQVSLEARMGCGLGYCYSCTIKTKSGLKQVCKDGPVFDLDELILENVK